MLMTSVISGLKRTRLARYIATEEQSQIIEVGNPKHPFGVVIDPLDGSSLPRREPLRRLDHRHLSRPGSGEGDLHGQRLSISSMGPLTTLTFTAGKGVHEFVMNDEGEVRAPSQGPANPGGEDLRTRCAEERLPPGPCPVDPFPRRQRVQAPVQRLFCGGMYTRSFTRVASSPTPASKAGTRESSVSCMKPIRWE